MKKLETHWSSILFSVFTVFLISFGLTGCDSNKESKTESSVPVRIGWQTAWATQGQFALILKDTPILEKVGIDAEFVPFQYGAPMAEAAAAGKLDLAFVGDQPAISLMARSSDWLPFARLMDFRVAIVTPANSSIKTLKDLKGGKIGIPVGSSAHRVALEKLREAGLSTGDVNIVNIDIVQQGEILQAVASGKETDFAAFATWDPHIAQYEKTKTANILIEGRALGVIMIRKSFIDAQPKISDQLLSAFKDAYWYYAQNRKEVDGWFGKHLGARADLDVLYSVASIEPNSRAKNINEVSVHLGQEQIATLNGAAEFAFQNGLIRVKPEVVTYTK